MPVRVGHGPRPFARRKRTLQSQRRGGRERQGRLLDDAGPPLNPFRAKARVLSQAHSGFRHSQRRDLVDGGRLESRQPSLDQQDEDARGKQEGEEEGEQKAGRDALARVEATPQAFERKTGH